MLRFARSSRPAWVPVLLSLALFALPAALACSGGGGGSSPTEPSATPPANLAGSWTGTTGPTSAEGYCSEMVIGGFTHEVDLEIQQAGASLDVAWTNRVPIGSITCLLNGSVSGNRFTLAPDFGRSHPFCGPEQDMACGLQPVRRVQDTDAGYIRGTVSGGQMRIESEAVFDYYDKRGGQHLGRGTVRGSVELRRR